MTISTTIIKNSYSGNASQTVFPYTFKISVDADIQVILRSALGVETVKSISTDYTVSGAGDANGGNVTMVVAPASGETLVIRRATIQTQNIDLVENDPFSAETVEGGFDKSVSLVQEIQEEADRAIKLSRTNTMASTEFTVDAVSRAGKILGFDSAGELVVSQELGTFKGNWSSSATYATRDIIKDTSNNNIYLANTGHTSSGSQPISSNADVAKWDLLVDAASATISASTATTQAGIATTKAGEASASASAALTSENNSATSETNSANSATTSSNQATASANSATASANSASAAAASFDLFDDSYLGAKASNPTVDNDGNALTDGALYFDTTNDVMKVYDLATTTWLQLTPTVSNQTNINAVNANSTNINAVKNNETNINAVNSNSANINIVAGIDTEITNVSAINAAISAVNTNSTNINAVNNNSTNINTVAGLDTEITALGASGTVASINTVASNLADINAFANIYLGPSGTAPTADPDGSALDVGDLYFDTVSSTMKVYSSGGWIAAGSAVNGTSNRFEYTATAGQTTFTGSDSNSAVLAYDAGFVDVYLNGIKLANSDYTASSGTSVVLGTGAAVNDILMIVAFGTFSLANFSITAANDVPAALGTAGQALVVNSGATALEFSNASSAEIYGFNKYYNPSTLVKTVTAVGGVYVIDGVSQDTLDLYEGNTYVFNHPSSHPFRFSTDSGNSSAYTTGVTVNSSTQVTIVVASNAPTLYYYCSSHSNMGGQANTPTPANNAARYITTNQGADNIDAASYAGFDDVLFSASGFVFSISNGNLIATI